jgi:hypothetical protein
MQMWPLYSKCRRSRTHPFCPCSCSSTETSSSAAFLYLGTALTILTAQYAIACHARCIPAQPVSLRTRTGHALAPRATSNRASRVRNSCMHELCLGLRATAGSTVEASCMRVDLPDNQPGGPSTQQPSRMYQTRETSEFCTCNTIRHLSRHTHCTQSAQQSAFVRTQVWMIYDCQC